MATETAQPRKLRRKKSSETSSLSNLVCKNRRFRAGGFCLRESQICYARRTSMGELISTRTAEHYRWGEGCDGWFLLKAEGVHVIEERMPPGREEKRHYHSQAEQLFYVL